MIERKFYAHYIDAHGFPSVNEPEQNNVRLGDDLEEYVEDLNPDVETSKNIKGESRVKHSGYEVSSEVDPYYADFDSPLFEPLWDIAMERKTGDACKTHKYDILVTEEGKVYSAYREDVYVIPNSTGGDTSGVQIPFTVYNTGNRVKGKWDIATKKFTTDTSEASK